MTDRFGHEGVRMRIFRHFENRRRCLRERGSATIWTIALMTAVWAVAMVVVQVGVARVARHRAQSAADLGALGAARVALATPDEACDRAEAITTVNGASLRSCALSDGVAEVTVTVRFAVPLLGPATAAASAEAGPVGAVA
ncbi:Rv3654c family TadE-like protein [Microbispora sp. NPDC049633]|uniref:Rv3654c family TadE-like protein n=1 Tax=Microbispora sp. NPDC049633 TaxID=3154355 RepID=UPI00343D8A23